MKKFVIIIMVVINTILLSMPLFAADQTISTEGTASVNINADVVSTFELVCPTSVDIVERGIKDFVITASGTISSKEYLKITMPEKVTMTTEGKTPIDLVVTIDNTELDDVELAATTEINCSVDASEITSGEWTGSIEVDVALIDTTVVTP